MQYVNFFPWVGKNYTQGIGQNHVKLLVLGESHYCHDLGCAKCSGCNLSNCLKLGYTKDDFHNQTIEYVKDLVYSYSGANYQQTGICFERAVMGKILNQTEREDFWNRLIFYNFIQKDLPKKDGERTPVSKDDLIGSQEALEEILSIYQPDKIVVWGSRLYNILPSLNGTGKTLQTADGAKTDIWIYTINGKSIPCMKVNHPSTPSGKSWEHWHKFYTEFLR